MGVAINMQKGKKKMKLMIPTGDGYPNIKVNMSSKDTEKALELAFYMEAKLKNTILLQTGTNVHMPQKCKYLELEDAIKRGAINPTNLIT